jgi:hypothetical protein
MIPMGLFDKFKRKDLKDNPLSRKGEEALYRQALNELESGSINKGVFAKALADSSGDEGKAHSLYLKYRTQSILDDKVLHSIRKEEEAKNREERNDRLRRIFVIIVIVLIIYFYNL